MYIYTYPDLDTYPDLGRGDGRNSANRQRQGRCHVRRKLGTHKTVTTGLWPWLESFTRQKAVTPVTLFPSRQRTWDGVMDATPLTERARVAVTSAAISMDGRSVTTRVLAACNWGVELRVQGLGYVMYLIERCPPR